MYGTRQSSTFRDNLAKTKNKFAEHSTQAARKRESVKIQKNERKGERIKIIVENNEIENYSKKISKTKTCSLMTLLS